MNNTVNAMNNEIEMNVKAGVDGLMVRLFRDSYHVAKKANEQNIKNAEHSNKDTSLTIAEKLVLDTLRGIKREKKTYEQLAAMLGISVFEVRCLEDRGLKKMLNPSCVLEML